MYKKLMITGLFLASAWSIFTCEEIAIPYENYIAKEYNRIRAGADKYSSFHDIMNQNLRGKSNEQKNKIINDFKALKLAVRAAYNQAEHDGKSLWYYFYIWKDNNPAIQSLIQHESDVTYKIRTSELELQPDIIRLLWYITPFTAGVLSGITLVWLTQGNLSYDYYVKNKCHGPLEMFKAPASEGLKVGAFGIKNLLWAAGKGAEYVKAGADVGANMLGPKPPINNTATQTTNTHAQNETPQPPKDSGNAD
jgi:hypothetical protein